MPRSAAQKAASRAFYVKYAPQSRVYADQGHVDPALEGAVFWHARARWALRYERTVTEPETGEVYYVGTLMWSEGAQVTGQVSLRADRLRRVQ